MDQSNTAQANSKLKKETAKAGKLTSDKTQIDSKGKSIPVAATGTGTIKIADDNVAGTNDSISLTKQK